MNQILDIIAIRFKDLHREDLRITRFDTLDSVRVDRISIDEWKDHSPISIEATLCIVAAGTRLQVVFNVLLGRQGGIAEYYDSFKLFDVADPAFVLDGFVTTIVQYLDTTQASS